MPGLRHHVKCWMSGGAGPGEAPDERAHQLMLLPPCMALRTHACGARVSFLGCTPGQQGQAVAPAADGAYCLWRTDVKWLPEEH